MRASAPREDDIAEFAFLMQALNRRAFTLRDLAADERIDGALPHLLWRYRRFLKRSDPKKPSLFKVRSSARAELRAHARGIWERIGVVPFDAADDKEKWVKFESLDIAEGYAHAAARASTRDEVELFAEKASIWLNGALRRIEDWKRRGVAAPDPVLNRVETIRGILAKIADKKEQAVRPPLIPTAPWCIDRIALTERLFKWCADRPLLTGAYPEDALAWMRIVFDSPARERWLEDVFDGRFEPFQIPQGELPATRLLAALCSSAPDRWAPALGEYVAKRVLGAPASLASLLPLAEFAATAVLTERRDIAPRLSEQLLSVETAQLNTKEAEHYKISLGALAMWASPLCCATLDKRANRISEDCRVLGRRDGLCRLVPALFSAAARGSLARWSTVAEELLVDASERTLKAAADVFSTLLQEADSFHHFAQDPDFLFTDGGRVFLSALEARHAARVVETDRGFMLLQPELHLWEGPLRVQGGNAGEGMSRRAHARTTRTTKQDARLELGMMFG